MSENKLLFKLAIENTAPNKALRKRIQLNMKKYHDKVKLGKVQFNDLEKTRTEAHNIKKHALQHAHKYLLEFESNFTKNGGKVIWAKDSQEALSAIERILVEKESKRIVKSKSMITEEIELNAFLESRAYNSKETDLGEFIVQMRKEKPYHIVTPAMHLNLYDISKTFHMEYNTELNASAETLTEFTRNYLKEHFRKADVGITGANFIVPDTGSIVLVENEGNARLCASLPKVHIALVGIEKLIPTLEDLDLFLPLLSTYGTDQKTTVYNSIISGPKQDGESDGPEEMYVILLDNGRSKMMKDPALFDALMCIRCGACLNNCPVYQTIGGHSYNSSYPGPIGAVISPYIGENSFSDYAHLSHASSLCGSCTDNCPVKINIHEMLHLNRVYDYDEENYSKKEYLLWQAWKKASLNRSLMNAPHFSKKIFGNLVLNKLWGNERTLRAFPKKTFNQLWKEGKV